MSAIPIGAKPSLDDATPLWREMLSVVTTTAFVIAGLALIGGVLGSAVGWYRLDVVLSGSMKPEFAPGDMVYAKRVPNEQISAGDIIMFRTPAEYGGATVTHRVVRAAMSDTGAITLRTKGDNNDAVDPWTARVTTDTAWVVQQSIPNVGYVAHWAKTWWPLLIALVASMPMFSFALARVKEVNTGHIEPVPATANASEAR